MSLTRQEHFDMEGHLEMKRKLEISMDLIRLRILDKLIDDKEYGKLRQMIEGDSEMRSLVATIIKQKRDGRNNISS